MSMSKYATYADYHASLTSKSPIDKDATLARIQAMAAEAEAESQMKRDAARYRFLRAQAYEAVVPHGGVINGSRTAWITKMHAGTTFDAAIDAALAVAGERSRAASSLGTIVNNNKEQACRQS